MRGIKFVSEHLPTGYGEAGRGYLCALRKTGIPVTWTPMVIGKAWNTWLQPFEGTSFDDPEFGDLVNRPIDYDVVIVHLIPDYLERWRASEPGKKLIGLTVWELDRLPETHIRAFNAMDGIIVPCRWNRELFRSEGVRPPVAVVPHFAPSFRSVAPLDIPGVRPGDFVFYTIAAWRERKAPHLTLECFLRTFTAEDPAVLLIKTSPVNERRQRDGFWWYRVVRQIENTARDVARIRKASGSSARIVLLTEEMSAGEIAALHAQGDCYVSMTRAEGWGLGAYEAVFAGKPVVMTGYGGQLDFLPADLAYLVDYRLAPYHPGQGPGRELMDLGARWAEPDLASGSRLMREVFENPSAARERGRRLQGYVINEFDNERITRTMVDFIKEIAYAGVNR